MSAALDHQHTGPWTIDDVMALDEDSTQRYELVGETLMMSPAPGAKHQRASYRLRDLLEQAAETAEAPVEVTEAVNVELPNGLFVPDIAVVDAAAAAKDPVKFDGEDIWFVVEIVSPSSSGRRIDRLLKPPYYAEAGIEWFWRLELEPSPTLIVAQLEDGRYVDRVVAEADRLTWIERPFPIELDPGALVRPRR